MNRRAFFGAIAALPSFAGVRLSAPTKPSVFKGREGQTRSPEVVPFSPTEELPSGPRLEGRMIADKFGNALVHELRDLHYLNVEIVKDVRLLKNMRQVGLDLNLHHKDFLRPMWQFEQLYLQPGAEAVAALIRKRVPDGATAISLALGDVPDGCEIGANSKTEIPVRFISVYDLYRDELITRFDVYYSLEGTK